MSKKSEAAALAVELAREEKLHKTAVKHDEQALSGERTRFGDLVVGRHYNFVGKAGGYVGELAGTEKGGVCYLRPLRFGQEQAVVELNFKDFDVREIGLAQAHDLSRV